MNHSQTERDTHSHLIIPLTRIRAVYRTHVQACWVLDPDPANTSLGCDSSEQIFSDFNRTDFRHANLWPAEQAPCRREPSMWQWPASEALPARRSWPWQHSCCWASEICARAHRGIGKQMRLLIVSSALGVCEHDGASGSCCRFTGRTRVGSTHARCVDSQ